MTRKIIGALPKIRPTSRFDNYGRRGNPSRWLINLSYKTLDARPSYGESALLFLVFGVPYTVDENVTVSKPRSACVLLSQSQSRVGNPS